MSLKSDLNFLVTAKWDSDWQSRQDAKKRIEDAINAAGGYDQATAAIELAEYRRLLSEERVKNVILGADLRAERQLRERAELALDTNETKGKG